MSFPKTSVPSTLPAKQYKRLVELLALHYSYPLAYPLAGAYFEEVFAASVNGSREEEKNLFDVVRGGTGWSLKTLLWNTISLGDPFELVLQRCDILKDRSLTLESPIGKLGAAILKRFNDFCEASALEQGVNDPRAGFLLRDRAEENFVFFQQRYRLYSPDEVSWQWANGERRSLMGRVGERLILRWYRSGTQLFGVYQIPEDSHQFQIKAGRADLAETIRFFKQASATKFST